MRSLKNISSQIQSALKPTIIIVGERDLNPKVLCSVMDHVRQQHGISTLALPMSRDDVASLRQQQVSSLNLTHVINKATHEAWNIVTMELKPADHDPAIHPVQQQNRAIVASLQTQLKKDQSVVLVVPAPHLKVLMEECERIDSHAIVAINTWNASKHPHAHSTCLSWMSDRHQVIQMDRAEESMDASINTRLQ